MSRFTKPVPLSLYIHFPWCVRKCPYCDFNSHELRDSLDEKKYIQALLADVEQELPDVWGRPIQSVFMGGGTPSLFSPESLDILFSELRARLNFSSQCEITLEANPGTLEQGRFSEYRQLGINRLSIGIQSFDDDKLEKLGRIHDRQAAYRAVEAAHDAGFERFNLDLMYGLPEQNLQQAVSDIDNAIALEAPHISHYQLTLEPNTLFYLQPPSLADDDQIYDMQLACQQRLAHAGYQHYEVSAYAREGQQCRHNINYWQFGDYLGIGAGAHGKLTFPATGQIERRWKIKHPAQYLQHASSSQRIAGRQNLTSQDIIFEFMMNALRLTEGFAIDLFSARTGYTIDEIRPVLEQAGEKLWLEVSEQHIAATDQGQQFLNELLQMFLPDDE